MQLKRLVRVVGLVLGAALLFGAGVWAGRTAFQVSEPTPESTVEVSTVAVTQGAVGRTLDFGVVIQPEQEQVAVNLLDGLVTARVFDTPAALTPGQHLYSVNGTPVRALQSDTPFYRDLYSGLTGDDVTALQRSLAEMGYLNTGSTPSGKYDRATLAAVKAWQKDLQINSNGIIGAGELLAVPDLTQQFSLADAVVHGQPIANSSPVLFLQLQPSFQLRLGSNDGIGILPGQAAEVTYDGNTWSGVLSESFTNEEGFEEFRIEFPQAEQCSPDCSLLALQQQVFAQAKITVTPEVSGPAIPIAALRTGPGGAATVQLVDGQEVGVEVLGSGQGLAVVDGLSVGQSVVLNEQ